MKTAEITQLTHAIALAKDEIIMLRRENEILRAKVETFEGLMLLFHTRPSYKSECASEDTIWALDKALGQIKTPPPGDTVVGALGEKP